MSVYKGRLFETIVGALVMFGFIGIFVGALYYKKCFMNDNAGPVYRIGANFTNIDGIQHGSAVKVAGVIIGRVASIKIDENYTASVWMDVGTKIPQGSTITVASEGILGARYLNVIPGSEDTFLQNGQSVEYTQSALNLEDMISKLIFHRK